VTKTLVGNVQNALASEILLPDAIEMPSLLPAGQPRDLVALDNGLLDLGQGTLAPHTPDWFACTCLPFRFDPMADCPKWKSALDLSLGGDPELIDLLQEWFGYNLLPDNAAQRFVVLAGEGNNGKGVVCAALEALLGGDNVCSLGLEAFGQRFALASTLGKLANIVSEVGELDKTAEGILKAFTSGDRMPFDRKGKPLISARPTARLTLATNNPPRFVDKSLGVWRRLILFPLGVQIPPERRVVGMDKPDYWERAGELPGLLNWALAGLMRLRANAGQFTRPAAC
jgi:P4 family phage/plasmid primase-like protien